MHYQSQFRKLIIKKKITPAIIIPFAHICIRKHGIYTWIYTFIPAERTAFGTLYLRIIYFTDLWWFRIISWVGLKMFAVYFQSILLLQLIDAAILDEYENDNVFDSWRNIPKNNETLSPIEMAHKIIYIYLFICFKFTNQLNYRIQTKFSIYSLHKTLQYNNIFDLWFVNKAGK